MRLRSFPLEGIFGVGWAIARRAARWRINEGVTKGTSVERPQHGAVTHLTLDEMRAVVAHWHADIDLE